MTAGINPENVSGIVTELGGKTSHSAILARALEIPAVVAVNGLMDAVKDGDSVVLDGSTGEVFVNPEASVEKEYEEKRSQFLKTKRTGKIHWTAFCYKRRRTGRDRCQYR